MASVDDFTRFVPHSTLDPHTGRPVWAARHEGQGVDLICDDEAQAQEVAEFLNARRIEPLVAVDPDDVEDADEDEAIEDMEDDDDEFDEDDDIGLYDEDEEDV